MESDTEDQFQSVERRLGQPQTKFSHQYDPKNSTTHLCNATLSAIICEELEVIIIHQLIFVEYGTERH